MASDVLGKSIIMIRGDSACFVVEPKFLDGTPYEAKEGDTITFTLKKNYSDETPLLTIDVPIDTMELNLIPEDTENLGAGLMDGWYKYDIVLVRADGWKDTFISRANFLILEEVH
jgi:hypothetical protein